MKSPTWMFWIGCLVSIGGILYGYDIGVIAGALLFISNAIPMTELQTGIVVGAVLGGALAGTLLAGPIGDTYGRRFLITLSSFIFILGVGCILIANGFLLLLAARLLLGIGVGLISVAVPLYVAEMVPAKNRGRYMTFFQLQLTFGIMLAYLVDLAFTPSQNWRAMFAVVLVPALILFIGGFFLPETPRWLIAHDKNEKARQVLSRVSQHIEEELTSIQNSLQTVNRAWQELFSPQYLLATMIAISIAIFNQLTGINAFLQYAPIILKNAGMSSNIATMLSSVGIGFLNLIATFFAIGFIDTLGRRPLLLTGIFGVILAEIFLGLIQYGHFATSLSGILALLGLCCFIIFFAIGPGVVVWLAISELFPTRVRGKGIAICLFFNSLTSTLLAMFFLPLLSFLGTGQIYFFFACCTFLYFIVALFFLPETKTKSLEDIQLALQRKA